MQASVLRTHRSTLFEKLAPAVLPQPPGPMACATELISAACQLPVAYAKHPSLIRDERTAASLQLRHSVPTLSTSHQNTGGSLLLACACEVPITHLTGRLPGRLHFTP
jgi:hypothetical protein